LQVIFVFSLYNRGNHIVHIEVLIYIGQECTLNECNCSLKIRGLELLPIRKYFYEKNIYYGVDTKNYLLLRVLIGQSDLEAVLTIVARFKLIIAIVLSGLRTEFAHKFKRDVRHVRQQGLQTCV